MNITIPKKSEKCCAKKCDDIFNEYTRKDANLSDLTDIDIARDNLDVFSRGETADRFFSQSLNLSELTVDFVDPDDVSNVIESLERQQIARDSLNVYSKDETYNKSEVYTKEEVYNKEETYNKTEVYNKEETLNKDELELKFTEFNDNFVHRDGSTPIIGLQEMIYTDYVNALKDASNVVNVGMLTNYVAGTGGDGTFSAGDGIIIDPISDPGRTIISVALGAATVVTPQLTNGNVVLFNRNMEQYGESGIASSITVDNGTTVTYSGKFTVPAISGNTKAPDSGTVNLFGTTTALGALSAGFTSDEYVKTMITSSTSPKSMTVTFNAQSSGLKVDGDNNVYMPTGGTSTSKSATHTIAFAGRRYWGYSDKDPMSMDITELRDMVESSRSDNSLSELSTSKDKTIVFGPGVYSWYAYDMARGPLGNINVGVETFTVDSVANERTLEDTNGVANRAGLQQDVFVYSNKTPNGFANSSIRFY